MVMKKEELSKLPVSTKQQRIAEIARRKRGEPLTLPNRYIDEKWLITAYSHLRKESAPGVDGQTVLEYGQNLHRNVKSLLKRAKTGTYRAPAVRRAKIPKPGNKKEFRPLGIPTTEDKVLQKAVLMILEPIYEPSFYNFSYGFRKGKSQHQALDYLWQEIMWKNIQWIIDLDIRKFFDTVKHEILRQLLRKRVRDRVITRLVGKWLKAGVLEDGSIHYNDEGTPQGGIVKRKTSGKKFREKVRKINEWCKKHRHDPIEYQHKKLSQKLKGHYAYYGITGNMRGMQRYLDKVKRIWKKWLCRRSWKTKLNWEKFNIFLTQRCPLPPVKVVHSIYAKRAANQ